MSFYETTPGERIRAALPALAVHGLIALVLLRGLDAAPALPVPDALKLIELLPETLPPPPPEPPPPTPKDGPREARRQADPRPEGAASPPNLHATPTPIVAPEPIVPPLAPPPIPAAPVAGPGFDPSAGAADIPGPGTGSGGFGTGRGSGRGGGGLGGGGGGRGGDGFSPPRWLRGRIADGDYPRGLGEVGVGGRVSVRYTVEVDGRATNCIVTRSSGSPELDSTTCRLIEQRFRFDPSRDRAGRPVRSQIVESHEWVVEDLPPEPGDEPPRRRRRF